MNFPPKETYINYLYNSKGKRIGKLVVTEGSLQEYNDFIKLESKEQIKYIANILLKSYEYTIFDKVRTFFKSMYVPKGLIVLQQELSKEKEKGLKYFDYYVQSIVKKKFGAESIYDGVKLVFPESKGPKRKNFEGTAFKQVCSEWGIDPIRMIREYTIKQYTYMQDCIIFEGFEQDDKTKINNDRALKDDDGISTDDIKSRLPKRKIITK